MEKKKIILTVDVEDWFQVENLRSSFPKERWDMCELRVEKNTMVVMDLFDEVSDLTGQAISATFFVLGWIAERFPELTREIKNRGHEVASHGYSHKRCSEITKTEFKNDLIRSRKLLEDLTGDHIWGYRAPSFDISLDDLRVIEDCGYQYDSSYNSFSAHGRYGNVDLSPFVKEGIAIKITGGFFELPVSNLSFFNRVIPWGGGGYFRLIPSKIYKKGMERMIENESAFLFYTHPWEFDPEQPRINTIPFFYSLRHYVNLAKTRAKLKTILTHFSELEVNTCRSYLANMTEETL